jgi:hypothetical protein
LGQSASRLSDRSPAVLCSPMMIKALACQADREMKLVPSLRHGLSCSIDTNDLTVAQATLLTANREVSGDEFSGINVVGMNAANLARGNDNHVGLGRTFGKGYGAGAQRQPPTGQEVGRASGPHGPIDVHSIRWRHSSCLGRDGIKPAQPAKPRKVTIGGAQRKPVFHGQRRQMSVWYKIAMYAGQREKLT